MSKPLDAWVDGVPAAVRIELAGDITGDADAVLADAYAQAVALDASEVLLDFSRVDYINSTGIALIVRLLADARRSHRTVRARGLSAHYVQIFRITRLSDFMTVEDADVPMPSMQGSGQ